MERDEDFLFSLYAGDLIRVVGKKEINLQLLSKKATGEPELRCKEWLLFYAVANISSGAITLTTHDRKYGKDGLGVKTLNSIEKYVVDILGEYHRVRLPEKRPTFR